MSYNVFLTDPVSGETLELEQEHFMRGGTYAIGGTRDLWLNITYNYNDILRRKDVLGEFGVRSLYGMSGAESIPVLERAISVLHDNTDLDYWKSTEGNVKRALYALLAMARMRPDGVWRGD